MKANSGASSPPSGNEDDYGCDHDGVSDDDDDNDDDEDGDADVDEYN